MFLIANRENSSPEQGQFLPNIGLSMTIEFDAAPAAPPPRRGATPNQMHPASAKLFVTPRPQPGRTPAGAAMTLLRPAPDRLQKAAATVAAKGPTLCNRS
jgi:hypothetical protein